MSSPKNLSLQAILKQRQQNAFIGREKYIDLFRNNLSLPLDDPRRRFIFMVNGQGGVGKTFLLRRFRQVAENANAVTSWSDEAENDIPSVMGRIAEQLKQQNHEIKKFDERYKTYLQLRKQLEADPEVPQELPTFIGHTLAKTGIRLGRHIPIGGAVFDFIDEEGFASQVGKLTTYVTKKITNKDEVHLVLDPVEVLTPLFIADIQKITEHQSLVLFFDTYERTRDFLDKWLQDLLSPEGRYGEVPANVLIVIGGQQELNKNSWIAYSNLIERLSLDRFSEDEARKYLESKEIKDEHIVQAILRSSERLPLLVATLASKSPLDPDDIGDPSSTAIERFLKWVEDGAQKKIAVDAALPRELNRDVLSILMGQEDVDTQFLWLKERPFVRERSDAWVYHDVVRNQMLRHKRRTSLHSWNDLHQKLGDYFTQLRDDLQLDAKTEQRNPTWQDYTLEILYHRLCRSPSQYLRIAIDGFLAAYASQPVFAHRYAEVMKQAGIDSVASEVKQWGEKLGQDLSSLIEKRHDEFIRLFKQLLAMDGLSDRSRFIIFSSCGWAYLTNDNYGKAITSFTNAIQIAPNAIDTIVDRGAAYRLAKRYEDATNDFNYALNLDPDNHRAHEQIGLVYRSQDHYEEAIKAFTEAERTSKKCGHCIAHRGITFALMYRFPEALDDFNHAIELGIDGDWVIRSRSRTLLQLNRYSDALNDLNHLIDLNPKLSENLERRADIFLKLGRYDEAIADCKEAIKLNPETVHIRQKVIGHALVAKNQPHKAVQAFLNALSHEPVCSECWKALAQSYKSLYSPSEVIQWLRRIPIPRIDRARVLASRSSALATIGYLEEALVDCSLAIKDNKTSPWPLFVRAKIYRNLKRYDEALRDIEKCINLDPHNVDGHLERSHLFRLLGRSEDAIANCTHIITIQPSNEQAFFERHEAYTDMRRYNEALSDFDQSLTLKKQNNEYDELDNKSLLNHRGLLLSYLGRYEEAINHYKLALDNNPLDIDVLYNLQVATARCNKTEVEEQDISILHDLLNKSLYTDKKAVALYGLGGLEAILGNITEAINYLEQAIEVDSSVADLAEHDVAWLDIRDDIRFKTLIMNTGSRRNVSNQNE